MMKPIKRKSIREQVFEQLKEQIINGNWLPGSKIPSENELSASLQVSRVTVREAIQKLITLGLLETHQGEGTYVKKISANVYMNSLIPLLILDRPQIMHVLEYRKITEVAAMALVIERVTNEDICRLESILDNMRKKEGDVKKFAEEDLNFHLALVEITRNPVLVKVNHVIKDILNTSMDYIVQYLGTHDGLYYHEKIIKSIKDRNVEKAKQLMEEHIEKTIEKIAQIEEKNIVAL